MPMNVVMLPGGILRVPTVDVLANGVRVHGTRDVTPKDSEYEQWLPFAIAEDQAWHEDGDDEAILARWRAAASA
ncbi:hypothetical protein ACIBG4_22485 [Nonomuraea sp. NPDC050383]|uniref:hypothetical protein n=1 Tax=Nonomuraea sp. NPDC050383 TaxID=3364362 RepID=UPI00378FE5E6